MLTLRPIREKACFCGPASFSIVLDFYGKKLSQEELGRHAHTTLQHGTSAKNLIRTAKLYGFDGKIKDNCTFQDLAKWLKAKIPVIVDWFSEDDGHYSVVASLDKKYIYLEDPEIAGIKKIDLVTFKRIWFDFPADYIKNVRDVILRRAVVIVPKKISRKK